MLKRKLSLLHLPGTGWITALILLTGIVVLPPVTAAMQSADMDSHWRAPEAAALRPNPRYPDEESLDRGKLLFRKYCVSCHGRDGEGDGPFRERLEALPMDLSNLPDQLTDGDLAWKIANGRDPMPAWKDILQEEEIWDIVNFIRSLNDPAGR